MSTQFNTGLSPLDYWAIIAAGPAENPLRDNSWVNATAAYANRNKALANALANPPTVTTQVATITAASGNGTDVTVTAANTFEAGQLVRLSGLNGDYTALNNQEVAVLASGLSASQFEFASTVGTAIPLTITAVTGSGTVVTFTAANSLAGGESITFAGLGGAWTGFNTGTYTVVSANSTSFTVASATTGATTTGTASATPTPASTGLATAADNIVPLPSVALNSAAVVPSIFDYSPQRYVL